VTRILHLSDPHFGAADLVAAETFLEQAAVLAPDLTLLSGDLTMRVRRREVTAAKAFVERLPRPHLVIPGNHDIPLIRRLSQPFRRYQAAFGAELEPELVTNGVHIVSLNSSRAFGLHADWSEGRLSENQLLRMQEKFQQGPPDHFRALVLHHPLLELQNAKRAVVKPLEKLMQALETARVDLVMCGHFHRSQILSTGVSDHWKTIISQAPTVCSTRLQGEPQGFHEILLRPGCIETIHHVYREKNFVPADHSTFRLGSSGWSYDGSD
jgi:3',5'-cyclic AMP phosphodiesterase CpdA